jgi:hypothetical protein
MKKYLLIATVMIASVTQLAAQVKIGNNPNTINVNSILELESTDKGFLPPRVALTSLTSSSPLTASVAEGTLVYSDGGTLTDGYYFWNGTKWVGLAPSRTNSVLVKSAADLPAPVAGVITLVTGTEYQINGTIMLTNKINLNGCSVRGEDAGNDKLVYTGTGELFTGTKTGSLRFLSIATPAASAFNIDGGGVVQNMIIQNCYFLGCNSVGTIAGVGGTVFMSTVAYFQNTNGITFQNDHNVVLSNTLWDISNYNVYEKFIGAFNVIQILGGDRLVSSTNTATALHISGITSLVVGSVKVVMFVGTGAFVSGTFSNAWEVESTGVNSEKDDTAGGNMYITSPAMTVIASTGVPVKVAGTTTTVDLFRVTSPTSNRLTYTGSKSRSFHVICSLTAIQSSSNKYFSFYIAKNGVILPESRQEIKIINSSDQGPVTLSCRVTMAPNDYIELWVENETSNTDLTVQTMNLSIE